MLTATARDQSNSASVVSLDEGVQSTSSSGPSVETNPRATKLLVDLWLMTAASFRRSGRLEDARGAIQEAEALDADDPDVWVQVRRHFHFPFLLSLTQCHFSSH